jgi:hypothetical protein
LKDGEGDRPTGTTLKVYRAIIRAGKPIRISEVQRNIGLSTPSLAQYHINKLLEMGLVKEEGNGYIVDKVVIENVIKIRSKLIPFQTSYVLFFLLTLVALAISLVMQSHPVITTFVFIALSANVVALGISVYEMVRTFRDIR